MKEQKMIELKIDLPNSVLQALEREAERRGESLNTLVVHYLSLIKMMLINKDTPSSQWIDGFFERISKCGSDEYLEKTR